MKPSRLYAHNAPDFGYDAEIFHSAQDGDADALRVALGALGDEARDVLESGYKDYDGTILYGSINHAILMVNTDCERTPMLAFAEKSAKVAGVLRAAGAPCMHLNGRKASAFLYLDTNWDDKPGAGIVSQLMRDAIAAGDFDVDEEMPEHHSNIGKLLPLQAAFRYGNVEATRVLLDAGASLAAPLIGSTCSDIVAYARSFNQRRSDQVAALVAEAVMSRQLLGAGDNMPQTKHAALPNVPRRARAGL